MPTIMSSEIEAQRNMKVPERPWVPHVRRAACCALLDSGSKTELGGFTSLSIFV